MEEYLRKEFPDIQPTDKDFFNGRLEAYRSAAIRIENEKREIARQEKIKMRTQMWTPQQMAEVAFTNAQAIGKAEGYEFVLDKYNEEVFNLLCLYFTNDPKFEQYEYNGLKYSLSKGIWLQSPDRGSGKSVLLRSFYVNKRSCFGYKHTTELAVMFQKGGFDAIDKFIGPLEIPSSALNFYQTEVGFMYDELFGEEKVNHMGSPLSLSSYILNKLYDFSNNHRDKKWKFHCTSNSDGSDIEVIAGKTFRSRMPDMFNLIKLNGPDRRVS